MKRNLLTISLCTLLALSLGACEDVIPSIYTGDEDIFEHGSGTSEDKEDEAENTPEHSEHTYDEGEVTKEATCTEEGEIIYTCLECGDSYIGKIDPLGHDYVSTETEPTCGADGYYTKVCSRCGDTQTEASGKSATGEHTYILVADETDPSSGHHSVCSVCGEEESSELIEHAFTYIDNEDGETHTKVCECGYSDTESHALPESYTDNGDGTHSRGCECGYTETANHTYSSFDDIYCTGCDHVEAALDVSISLSNNEISVTGVSDSFNGGELVIPTSYHGYPITNIAKNAFKNNTDITSVTIPDSVTRIEEGGFYGCANMESVTFSENSTLNYIDYDGFRGCSSLTSFKMPDSVQSTGNEVFYNCTSLKDFYIRSDYGTLASHFFEKCTSLEEVTLPLNATSIKSSTFFGCTSLKEITIPSGVTSINTTAFYNCSSLTKIIGLEDSKVETIGQEAFGGCSSLTEIVFPSTLTDLNNSEIFRDCTNLETISIPDTCEVSCIGDKFALNCENLTGFTIPSTVTSIGESAFYKCYSLTGELVIPDGVTTIEKYAFEYCTGITSLIMGNNVTSIGDAAFAYCSALVSVVLSDGVSLSSVSFDYQYNSFTTVYYYGNAESWASLNVTNSHNTPLYNATVYFYSETYVDEYSWHLVDGRPSLDYTS